MKIICILILSLFVSSTTVYCQTPVEPLEDESLQLRIESISESNAQDYDYSDVIEDLNYYRLHPLDLNSADAGELKKLIFLNDIQINNLIEYRKKYGNLYSVYELQTIDGFYLDIIFRLLPYVYISNNHLKHSLALKNIFKYGNSKLVMKYEQPLEQQQGYKPISDSAGKVNPNSRYFGSPAKLFARYNFRYFDNISFGITAKKDNGEEFLKGTQKNGFDFYSAHLFLRNIGIIKSLAIGDFQAQFGQGIALSSGLTFYGKSAEVLSIRKQAYSLKPYTSTDENSFFRGFATTIGIGNIELTCFYSNKNIDANIVKDTSQYSQPVATSLPASGQHATQSQLQDKNTLNEQIYGGHLSYKINRLKLGITALKLQYDKLYVPPENYYNQFYFRGKENSLIGLDYNYSVYNLNFFGEAAKTENNGKAILNGILICPDSHVQLSVMHRYFAKDFQPVMSGAFSESSDNKNEEGFYASLLFKPSRTINISAYSDLFRSLWLKYNTNKPPVGKEYLLKFDYKPDEKLELYFLYRYRNKETNVTNEANSIDLTGNDIYNNYRFNLIYNASQTLTLRNRFEIVHHITPVNIKQNGYVIFQDLIFNIQHVIPASRDNIPFRISVRYALFDTDTYNERVYAFENDIPYFYSVPSYYYKGSRFYLLLHYVLNKRVDVWLKYSKSIYNNRQTIGTGLDQITGNTKSDIHYEMRISF